MASLKEGEWSCYKGGQFKGESGPVTVVASINGRIMIMLERWSVLWRECGHYGGYQFKGRRMVTLRRWSV